MSEIVVTALSGPAPAAGPVEIVERKGLGHPDSICDALAEALSLALCRYYREHFGLVLHHNVDKALLWGGAARPAYGGGTVIEPIEIYLAGRATREVQGKRVPVEELVMETGREWIRTNLRGLDPERHVRLHTLIRAGSSDLVELYQRQKQRGVALANDTSCGVGYAPLDELETVVLAVEHHLNDPATKTAHPAVGEDIKVMGVRRADAIELTVACAFIDRHLKDAGAYLAAKRQLAARTESLANTLSEKPVAVRVNTGDDETRGSFYLTVTGTSAEAGDDGEVGRGNRVNGLITPYRPMNMEAAAGKNPVTHVGKLYNVAARRIAHDLVQEVAAVDEAYCYLVSRIGRPVHRPQVVDLRLRLGEGGTLAEVAPAARAVAEAGLDGLHQLQDEIVAGAIKVY